MSIYSPHRRFVWSIATAVALAGLYFGFRVVTSPYLDIERKKQQFVKQEQVAVPEFRTDAARWFPGHPWVGKSLKHFRDNGRYLFCNDFDLIGNSVVVKPIAMLWPSDTNEIPVTIVADSAQLDRSTDFLNEDTEFGRITSGYISGRVRIDGPQSLRITGERFFLSEDSMMLWSGLPIAFAWNGHTGSATKGVEIHLHAASEADGLTDVTGITKVKLLGKVVCDVSVPSRRLGEPDLEMKVQAPGGFSFDVAMKTATFSGLNRPSASSESLKPSDEVWIRRTTPSGSHDHLVCPELKLTFRSTNAPDTGKPVDGTMQLEHVIAWGRKVIFVSMEHQLRLDANQLQYFVDQRRIDIRNTRAGRGGVPGLVKIERLESELVVPHLQVFHSVDGTIQRIECNRQGRLRSSSDAIASDNDASDNDVSTPPTEPYAIVASWTQSLVMQLAPDGVTRLLKIDGEASVAETHRDFRLSGKTIAMRLGTPEPSQRTAARIPVSEDGAAEDGAAQFDFSSLQPEILTAKGNVSLNSSQGSGHLREKLTVRFEPSQQGHVVQTVSATQSASGDDSVSEQTTPVDSVSFESDTLEAVVRIGPDREMEFYDVWLKGNVEVVRKSENETTGFIATGNQLYALNGLMNEREVQLFGDPARVVSQARKLEGPRIDLNELGGKAEVVGSGRIRFVTDKGLDGTELTNPMPIDIYWSDHMDFQKRSAHFVGNIRVSMNNGETQKTELRCAGLTVHFKEDVALGPKDPDGGFATLSAEPDSGQPQAGQIERIECHSKVTVKIDETVDGVANGRHSAVFADFQINLQTGDFHAIGPGSLESVSPDKDGQLQGASPPTARANSPAQTSETAFVYMQTDFIGELTGNLHRKEANLSQNVVALVAPARRVDEKIDLKEVPTEKLPERAGILQAEYITISGIQQSGENPGSFAMVARQNARLESRSLSARADVITYDHSKQQFIMRADGDGRVTVNHRAGTGGKFNRTTGNRFEYYRHTNQLKGNRIGGLDVNE